MRFIAGGDFMQLDSYEHITKEKAKKKRMVTIQVLHPTSSTSDALGMLVVLLLRLVSAGLSTDWSTTSRRLSPPAGAFLVFKSQVHLAHQFPS